MSDGTISVRDSLQASMTELAGPAEAVSPPASPAEAAAPAEVAAEAPADPAPASEGPARGPDGKFAPKTPDAAASAEAPPAAETKPETATPAEPEPQATETTRIPPSLPAAVKAQWSELKPEVQQAFVKLEDSVQTAKAEWGKKGERLNRYDEIMAPRSEKLTLQGIDEFTAIKTLFAAQDFLERDPLGGIRYLAQSYGVGPQQIAQAFGLTQASGGQPAAEGQQAPTAMPDMSAALQPYLKRVETLEQHIEQSRQATEKAELDRLTAETQAFLDDPANLYANNVIDEMATLLRAKAATSIADAYEKAIWASPEIRPLLLKAQAADAAKKTADEAARLRAANARQASGSVTGAPTPGAVAPAGPPGSVRDSLRSAMQELGAV